MSYEFRDLKKVESLKNHPEVIEDDGYYWDPTPLPGKDYSDSEVPTGFKKIADFVRSKIDGLQTREAMARLGEMVGINTHKAVEVAEENKQRQDILEQYTDSMIVEMTDKDVISAPELIDMRKGFNKAGDKIEDMDLKISQKASVLFDSVVVRIPSDYPNLQSAIDDLSTQSHKQGVAIILQIASGHRLTSGLKISDGNYGHFRIESLDSTVYLDASFPSGESVIEGTRAVMPTLACLIDGQLLYGQCGYFAREYSRGYVAENCGVKNLKGDNQYSPDMFGIGLMSESSEVYAYKSIFSGNRINLWATRTSRVFADTSDFKRATGPHGVFCSRSSIASISGSKITDCAENALTAYRSIVTAIGTTDVSNAGAKGVHAASGSTVIINKRESATPNISNSDYGIFSHASTVVADGALINGNRYGVHAENNGRVNAEDSRIENSIEVGIRAQESGAVNALRASIKNSGIYNVQCRFLSQVNVKDGTVSGAGTRDIFIDGGGSVLARGCTTTGSTAAGVPSVHDTNTFASEGGFDVYHPKLGVIWTNNPYNRGVGKGVGVSSGATSITVTFPVAEATTSYAVSIAPSWATVCWVTNKTVSGFTINFGTPPDTNRTVDWVIHK